MIKCLVVDDEPIAQRIIVSYIKDIPDMEMLACADHAIQAMEVLQNEKIDLMFLDIEMPKIKGLDFIRSLSHPPAIILTTAHREFALDGFDLGVVDYLLKPISFERFFQAVNKYKQLYHTPIPVKHAESNFPTHILLKSERKMFRINLSEIRYIEGMSNYVKVFTTTSKIIVYESLTVLLQRLPEYFIRTHKSYIVNRLMIHSFDKESVNLEGISIPIGKTYRNDCLGRLAKL